MSPGIQLNSWTSPSLMTMTMPLHTSPRTTSRTPSVLLPSLSQPRAPYTQRLVPRVHEHRHRRASWKPLHSSLRRVRPCITGNGPPIEPGCQPCRIHYLPHSTHHMACNTCGSILCGLCPRYGILIRLPGMHGPHQQTWHGTFSDPSSTRGHLHMPTSPLPTRHVPNLSGNPSPTLTKTRVVYTSCATRGSRGCTPSPRHSSSRA